MKEEKRLIMLPGPTNVPDSVMRAMTKPMINHRGPEFHDLFERVSENLKYVFQTEHDVFVLTSSGTGGVDCMVSNVVNPGDKILVPVFGAFSERLKETVIRRGGKPIEIQLRLGEAPSAEQVAEVIDGERDLKAIAIVYNETSTGVTVRDLPQIGELARKRDILLIVDAVSILGGDHLPVDQWSIDMCVTGSQKCLACPPGLAMISVSERAWKVIEKATRPNYFDLIKFLEFKRRQETPVTPAIPLFYALDEALRIVKEEGLESRFIRHATCAKALYKASRRLKMKPYPSEEYCSNTVIAINTPLNVKNTEVRRIMRDKYGVVISGGMGETKNSIFRIGCMGIVSEVECLLTVSALENALNDVGFLRK